MDETVNGDRVGSPFGARNLVQFHPLGVAHPQGRPDMAGKLVSESNCHAITADEGRMDGSMVGGGA
ncbi:hypothetical protein ZHAS_00007977 [Anopheles sinensis]|uniref:Uncharacterized protein n=1 Tax=Anopheles sinensis TaxID=74873 RepID=A0A084VR95_ANOSI|nr:hypothetical protein ZHAS_00007977 [Anopheles sinensis]